MEPVSWNCITLHYITLHCVTMWHVGLQKLCLESLLNILCIFSATLKHMFR
jgi:hypothetical protein